jgi:hypothetical protein
MVIARLQIYYVPGLFLVVSVLERPETITSCLDIEVLTEVLDKE